MTYNTVEDAILNCYRDLINEHTVQSERDLKTCKVIAYRQGEHVKIDIISKSSVSSREKRQTN